MQKKWFRLIGLILLAILIWRADLPKMKTTLVHADFSLFLTAMILNLPLLYLKAYRWRVLLASQGIAYGAWPGILAYAGSIFIGFLTPGRLGEFVKAVHVRDDCAVSLPQAFSSVLIDRLFDLYALLITGGAALLSIPRFGIAGFRSLVPLFVALIVPLIVFVKDSTFNYLSKAGIRLGKPGKRLFADTGWIVQLRQGLLSLRFGAVLRGALLTLAAYGLYFWQCYLLAVSLGLDVGFLRTVYAVSLGSLATLLPISVSGLGTREAAIIAYLGEIGISQEAALGFSLSVFINFFLAGGLIGALAWLIKPVSDIKNIRT